MSLGFTQIEYGEGRNKITLADCLTLKFEQEPVYEGISLSSELLMRLRFCRIQVETLQETIDKLLGLNTLI